MPTMPSVSQISKLRKAFQNIKAERDDLLKKTFVFTDVYRLADTTEKCIFVGRKGAGKTALLKGYLNNNYKKYLVKDCVDADSMPFQSLYSFFFKEVFDKELKTNSDDINFSDLNDFVSIIQGSSYAWRRSIVLMSCFVAVKRILLDSSIVLTIKERSVFNDFVLFVEKAVESLHDEEYVDSGPVLFSLIIHFFQYVKRVINEAIECEEHVSVESLVASITYRISRKLSKRTEERETEEVISTIGIILERLDKRALFQFDRFDDYYDHFYDALASSGRLNSDQIRSRRLFLGMLLEGAILAIRDIKTDNMLPWLDILFTIPRDKYLELHLRERQDLELSHVENINWSPVELKDFVFRRINHALGFDPNEINAGWEYLFPKTVKNAAVPSVQEDSFLYLARHSMWKPRELQMYILNIIKYVENTGRPIDESMIQQAVVQASRQIVTNEFIPEFRKEYPYLEKLLRRLQASQLTTTVMGLNTISNTISGYNLSDDVTGVKAVLIRMFQMGIVGVRKKSVTQMYGIEATITQMKDEVQYCFYYNCDESDPFDEEYEVVFHPLFYDYLHIDHVKDYVVNELKWSMFEYLKG